MNLLENWVLVSSFPMCRPDRSVGAFCIWHSVKSSPIVVLWIWRMTLRPFVCVHSFSLFTTTVFVWCTDNKGEWRQAKKATKFTRKKNANQYHHWARLTLIFSPVDMSMRDDPFLRLSRRLKYIGNRLINSTSKNKDIVNPTDWENTVTVSPPDCP